MGIPLICDNDKLHLISYVRDCLNIGLKEAKALVDSILTSTVIAINSAEDQANLDLLISNLDSMEVDYLLNRL